MKLLYIHQTYTPHDHRMLSAFTEHYEEVLFMRLDAAAPNQDPRPLPAGVRAVEWPEPQLETLQQVLDREAPDLLQAGPLTSGAYLAAQSGFHPFVAMSWGWDLLLEAKRDAGHQERVEFALSQADAVLGDCQTIRDELRSYGVPNERISAFPWGIDLQAFTLDGEDGGLRAGLGWQDAFVLLHVRSWRPDYGVEAVAEAFAAAAQANPNLRLLMPGAGPLEAKLRRIFEEAGLTDRVHLPGPISQAELPAYYRAADLYLSNSHSDGSSVSLMEALASGLPVLVSDILGNREWVEPGQQGWLFPVDDVDAIVESIGRATQADRHAMGQAARRRAEARADWQRNKAGLWDLHRIALEVANG
ncbi:MAG: glycosyltransferase [Proteobacteria bacterium]|nr:glycosyltransferase [Pseudomonadota bacterium]